MAKICGLNGGTGLGLVMAIGLGIVDGFGDGMGRKADFTTIGGEGFPDVDIGLTFGRLCIVVDIAVVVVVFVTDVDFDGKPVVGTGIELFDSSTLLLFVVLWPKLLFYH